jgi:hypothetical protein
MATTRYTRTEYGKDQAIPEGSTRLYSCTFVDTAGAAIPLSAINTLTLTLVDISTGTVIRSAVNVKGTNGGTIHVSSGAFSYVLSGDDVKIYGSGVHEKRLATFALSYASGVENHEVSYYVENLEQITTS